MEHLFHTPIIMNMSTCAGVCCQILRDTDYMLNANWWLLCYYPYYHFSLIFFLQVIMAFVDFNNTLNASFDQPSELKVRYLITITVTRKKFNFLGDTKFESFYKYFRSSTQYTCVFYKLPFSLHEIHYK